MNTEKANIQNSMDATEIPEYVFESLARSLLPVIQEYYESEGGRIATIGNPPAFFVTSLQFLP